MLIKFHGNQFHAPCVSIASTTLELLTWIKNTTNAGTITKKKNYNKEKHKDSYAYYLKYDDAINFLKEISDYLIISSKKQRAKLILDKYKSVTPQNGKYSKEMLKMNSMKSLLK